MFAWCSLLLVLCAASSCSPNASGEGLVARIAWLDKWVPHRRSSDRSLFFLARFETREQDVQAVAPEAGLDLQDEGDLPVVACDLPQALAWARLYWGRLPTYEEWSSAVSGPNTGPDRHRFPWGEDDGSRLHSNTLQLGLNRRTRVGTFESGRDLGSPLSCYDLIGNVAEWTIEPWPAVHSLVGAVWGRPSPIPDEMLPLARVLANVNPLAPATPFVAELCPTLFASGGGPAQVCTVGFSFAERLPARHVRMPHGDRNGVRPAYPGEWASHVGVRFATDPYTFLSLLERTSGAPTTAELVVVERFLLAHRSEFRQAAKIRVEAMDRSFLGLADPGEWSTAAYRILGLQ